MFAHTNSCRADRTMLTMMGARSVWRKLVWRLQIQTHRPFTAQTGVAGFGWVIWALKNAVSPQSILTACFVSAFVSGCWRPKGCSIVTTRGLALLQTGNVRNSGACCVMLCVKCGIFYNFYLKIQTVAFTGKHALPNDSQTKEILIRRHASIRRSLRPGSFQTTVSRNTWSIVHLFLHRVCSQPFWFKSALWSFGKYILIRSERSLTDFLNA